MVLCSGMLLVKTLNYEILQSVLPLDVVNAKIKIQITDLVFVAFRILSVANALLARKIYNPKPSYEPCKWCLFVAYIHILSLYVKLNLSGILKQAKLQNVFLSTINNYAARVLPLLLQLHNIFQNVRNSFTVMSSIAIQN